MINNAFKKYTQTHDWTNNNKKNTQTHDFQKYNKVYMICIDHNNNNNINCIK